MSKKTYWKDIWKSIGSSKGRFLSIMLLMMLGAFAFVGLKVTTPDMQRSATAYLDQQKTMDLTVIGSMGLGDADQKELSAIKNSQIDFGQMADVTIKDSGDAIRIFSEPNQISQVKLVKGKLPKTRKEIALVSTLQDDYKLGDSFNISQTDEGILKEESFTITAFVNSPEILSTTNLGTSTAGDGNLVAYAVTVADAFDSDVPTLARIRYNDLQGLSSFDADYKDALRDKQDQLDKLLEDNPKERLAEIKADPQDEIDRNQAKLDEGRQELSDNQKQLDEAKKTLSDQTDSLSQLPQEQAQMAQAQIKEAQADLEKKQDDLDKAKAELEQQAKDLAEAQADLDSLSEPSYSSYTRETLPGGNGYEVYDSGSESVAQIGNLFPVVLYLVAALVTFTTMTRFVDEERNNSAILKALGYSNRDVIRKFVIYGLIASFIGTILGILAGHYLLPPVIADIMTKDTTLPKTQYDFFWSYSVIALLLALVAAVLPAYLIARRELSEKAAQLLLPKPPVKGSKILLERFRLLWDKMSFTQKVTARNIFRYKQRMLMTIFGVAGSVALLFAGLGIQSSLSQVVDNQFGRLTPYDMMVVEDKDASKDEQENLAKTLQGSAISSQQRIAFANLSVLIPNQSQHQLISILVSDRSDFGDFIHLYETSTGDKVSIPKNGVLLSQKLASFYQVDKGDKITLEDADGKAFKTRVAGVIEMNAGHYVIMSQQVYQKDFKNLEVSPAHLVNLKSSSSQKVKDQARELLTLPTVAAIAQNSSLVDTVNSVVASLSGAMTILTIVAILLAIVILYNLTNINVAERIRELSTIKVLGFYNKEVTMYIYRETIILSIIGILVGLGSGVFLHKIIMGMIGGNDILFGTQVNWLVYAAPVTVVVVILVVLGWLVNHILKTVDMLEALKSVD
ncbi:FtsX-like permease family protein [Streptococcus hyovaginalis]|uniref:FtsX-like permease family protein n=1 Tax=Streptococcus hyovaginalis TaxID=149015 RepID=UPI003AE9EBFE